MGNGEGRGDNAASSGEVIEETARRTIGGVNGAQETYNIIQLI